MAGVSNNKASDQIAAKKKELEDARAMFQSMNVELGNTRDVYMQATENYKKAYDEYDNGNGVKGIDIRKDALDDAKTKMEDAYRAWLEDKDNAVLKKDYVDAKVKYDEANCDYIVALTAVRKVKALDLLQIVSHNASFRTSAFKNTDIARIGTNGIIITGILLKTSCILDSSQGNFADNNCNRISGYSGYGSIFLDFITCKLGIRIRSTCIAHCRGSGRILGSCQ